MAAAEILFGILAVACGAVVGRLGDMPGLRWPKPLYVVVVACSAVGAATAVTHATGWEPADAAWRIFLVVTLTIAASRANPASLLVTAAVVAAIAEPSTAWLGLAAIGIVVTTSVPAVRSIAGGLLGTGLLHAGWPGGRGATAAVAVAVLLLVVLSTDRRFITRAAMVGAGVLALSVLATASAGLSLARQRDAAIQAVDAGQLGLDAAREGRSNEAQAQFQRAADLLGQVDDVLRGPMAKPAFAVPIVGTNLEDVRALVAIARDIASSGVATASAADLDRIAPRDGALDLDALRSFAAPIDTLESTLTSARRRLRSLGSLWTVSALTDRADDLAGKVARARADTVRARLAVDTVPALLGGDGTRRYFLAVMTPSELRGGGGFVGNWGILEATGGKLTLPRFARITDLYRAEPYRVSVDPEYDDRYVRGWQLGTYPQNIMASPDLPSNAVAIKQILEQAGEGQIDGIIAVDPIAMAALLKLTGPIEVAGWGDPLDSSNVAETLLYRQYENADDPSRPELLARTTRALFGRLTMGTLPAATTVAEALGPAVEAGHLQFASLHKGDHTLLADAGLEHALEPPTNDVLAMVSQNAAPSKLDWFLRRKVSYDLSVDAHGQASGTVTVELRNTAPTGGLPATDFQYKLGGLGRGVNVQAVSVYSPLKLTSVTVDGGNLDFESGTEKGSNLYDRFVTLAPGATSTVVFWLEGTLRPGPYALDVRPQPTVVPDDLRVMVNGRELFDGPLTKDLHLVSPPP